MFRNTLSLIIATVALLAAPAIALYGQAGEWQADPSGKPQQVAPAPGQKEIPVPTPGQEVPNPTPTPNPAPPTTNPPNPPQNGGGVNQPGQIARAVDNSVKWIDENFVLVISIILGAIILIFFIGWLRRRGHAPAPHAPHGGGHGHPAAPPAPHGPAHVAPVVPPAPPAPPVVPPAPPVVPPAPGPAPVVPPVVPPPAPPAPTPVVAAVRSVTFPAPNRPVNAATTWTFRATVDTVGTASGDVRWTASAGTIDGRGKFTAPAVTVDTNVTVTATSVFDPTKSCRVSFPVIVPAPAAPAVAVAPAAPAPAPVAPAAPPAAPAPTFAAMPIVPPGTAPGTIIMPPAPAPLVPPLAPPSTVPAAAPAAPAPAPAGATTVPVIAIIGMLWLSVFGTAQTAHAAGLCDAVSVTSAFPTAAVPGKDTASLVKGSNFGSVVAVMVNMPGVSAAIVSKDSQIMHLRISASSSAPVLNRATMTLSCSDGSTRQLFDRKIMVMSSEQYAVAQGSQHVVEGVGGSTSTVVNRTVYQTDAATKAQIVSLQNQVNALRSIPATTTDLSGVYGQIAALSSRIDELASRQAANNGGLSQEQVERVSQNVYDRSVVKTTQAIDEIRRGTDRANAVADGAMFLGESNAQVTDHLLAAAEKGKKLSKKTAGADRAYLGCANHLATTGKVKVGCPGWSNRQAQSQQSHE